MTRFGPFTLHTIEAGTFGLDGGAMFGVIPKPLWQKRIPPDDRNRIRLAMRCLLIESSDRLVLVDNGIGSKYDAKFGDIYAIDDETDNLDRSLRAAGFDRSEITDVLLTHLHFDHCGGSTERVDGKLQVSFPSAQYWVQEGQWRSANDPNPRESGSFLKENLEPLSGSGQLELVDGDMEIIPGLSVLRCDGHTEKMQLARITASERSLVFAADLLPTRYHLRPAWTMAYDVRPLVTMREKAAFLSRALEEDWQLFFEHDPEVEVGSLVRGDNGPEVANGRPLNDL